MLQINGLQEVYPCTERPLFLILADFVMNCNQMDIWKTTNSTVDAFHGLLCFPSVILGQ